DLAGDGLQPHPLRRPPPPLAIDQAHAIALPLHVYRLEEAHDPDRFDELQKALARLVDHAVLRIGKNVLERELPPLAPDGPACGPRLPRPPPRSGGPAKSAPAASARRSRASVSSSRRLRSAAVARGVATRRSARIAAARTSGSGSPSAWARSG